MAGAGAEVFEFTTGYAAERFSFGRPLHSYQALKHRFADMRVWLEASQATTSAAAQALHRGDPDGEILAAVAKAYVGDRIPEVVQDCVQMHGGIGVTWDHDLHLYLRRITVDRGMYGVPDDHLQRVGAALVKAARS